MVQRLRPSRIVVRALAMLLMPLVEAAAMEQPGSIAHGDGQQSRQEACLNHGTSKSEAPAGGVGGDKSSNSCDTASCGTADAAALRYGLPPEFFRRLIRQESNFDPKAISRAGAMGIAQFMPGTARWRGVANPFEPIDALNESARWLSELRDQLGNLGLAAAAYNAGPRRVRDWISGRGQLPHETRAYVRIVTGRSAEGWLPSRAKQPNQFDVPASPCTPQGGLVSTKLEGRREHEVVTPQWGLRLLGGASETNALAEYARLQSRFHAILGDRPPIVIKKRIGGRVPSAWYFVEVGESSRKLADQLCSKLTSAGGSCLVIPN